MKTIKLPYKSDYNFNELIKQYSIIVRWSYNRFKDGLSEKEIRLLSKKLNNIDLLNSWLVQCGIKDGLSIYKKSGNNKVIFGSKSQFIRKCKGLIDTFNRDSPLNIQGESLQKGNRMFKLDIENNRIIFKLNKTTKIELNLPNLRKNYKQQLINLESNNNIKQGQQGHTYSVKIDDKFIYLSYEPIKQKIKLSNKRYIGIDLNPEHIGVSIFKDYKLLLAKHYDLTKINSHNSMKHELMEISKDISELLVKFRCKFIFLEKLNINSTNHRKGRNFNRLVNGWIRNKFIDNLENRISIYGGSLFKVSPAYSSVIGNLM